MLSLFFFCITTAAAFTLRGIWGHQLGGSFLGILTGIALSIWFKFPLFYGIKLGFWLAFAWAIASFVGWANYTGWQRFARGFFAYGMLPNIVLAIFLFPGNLTLQLEIIFFGALGMGIGFGLSDPFLFGISRRIIERKYQKNYPQGPKIKWGGIDQDSTEDQVSFIYVTKFDQWKVLLEIHSGLLYGISTGLILYFNQVQIPSYFIMVVSLTNLEIFLGIFIFVLLPLIGILVGFQKRSTLHDFRPKSDQNRWSPKKRKIASIISCFVALIISIFFVLNFTLVNWKWLFVIELWVINISGRLCHELDSPVFFNDLLIDFGLATAITILLVFI